MDDTLSGIYDKLTTECDHAIYLASVIMLAAMQEQDSKKEHAAVTGMIKIIKKAVTTAEQELKDYENNNP